MIKNSKSSLRAQILRAARKLLINEGSQNISMRKIAGEIGCKAPSIYYHFKNKDQLIHELIDEGFEKQFEALSAAQESLHSGVSPLDKLDCHMRAFVRFGIENPELYEVMYLMHSEEMTNFPRERTRRTRQSLELFASLYQEAFSAKLVSEENPELTATSIDISLNGFVTMVLMNRLDIRFDEDTLLEDVISRCLRSMGAVRESNEALLATT